MRGKLTGTLLKTSFISKNSQSKRKCMSKDKERSSNKRRLSSDKNSRNSLYFKESSRKTNKPVRTTSSKSKSKRRKCKKRYDSKRRIDFGHKSKTERRKFKILRYNKNRKSKKNIISRKNCWRPYPSALSSILSPNSSKGTFQWVLKWCSLTLKDKMGRSTWKKDPSKSKLLIDKSDIHIGGT